MQRLLEEINAKTIKDVIDFSKGLSLTDIFWVTNDLTQNWAGVNLFINEFDDVISHIAFGTRLHGGQISSTSPEFGTSGVLPKCWVRDRGTKKIFLKKVELLEEPTLVMNHIQKFSALRFWMLQSMSMLHTI